MMRNRQLLFTVFALFIALPAWAEEAAHGGGGKLPQFREEYFPGQLFWLGVSFLVLYLLLKNVALPRISKTQETRQGQRAADLTAAGAANDKANQIISDYEKSLAAARLQAQKKLTDIVQTAQAEAKQQQAVQHDQLQEKLHAAEQNIAVMRTQALSQVRDAAIDVAQAMVQRLTGLETNAAGTIDRLQSQSA